MRLKIILLGVAVIALSFLVGLKALDWLSPRAEVPRPQIADLPPRVNVGTKVIVLPMERRAKL